MSDAVIEAMARACCNELHGEAICLSEAERAKRPPCGASNCATVRALRAALHAAEAMGWRLVPVEATRDMRAAWALQSTAFRGTGIAYEHAREVWTAMLRAAPSLTGTGGDDARD